MVPFHVSTIKNISKSEEGRYIFLRINFLTPGFTNTAKDGGFIFPEIKDENGFCYKELTIRSTQVKNINNAIRLLKELIKRVRAKDIEESEK
mmetsp:Transcript_8235/g.1086  ORF Transcript_8235/g.1086 Transcript_8235/m.1086 type:complete len:92 (-) Transcript_8235:1118-1393(-)